MSGAFKDSGHRWWQQCSSCDMAWFIGDAPKDGEDHEADCERCAEPMTETAAGADLLLRAFERSDIANEARNAALEEAAQRVDEEARTVGARGLLAVATTGYVAAIRALKVKRHPDAAQDERAARLPEDMRPRSNRPDFCRHSERPEVCNVCNPLDPGAVRP